MSNYYMKFYNPTEKKWKIWDMYFPTEEELLKAWNKQPSVVSKVITKFRVIKKNALSGKNGGSE